MQLTISRIHIKLFGFAWFWTTPEPPRPYLLHASMCCEHTIFIPWLVQYWMGRPTLLPSLPTKSIQHMLTNSFLHWGHSFDGPTNCKNSLGNRNRTDIVNSNWKNMRTTHATSKVPSHAQKTPKANNSKGIILHYGQCKTQQGNNHQIDKAKPRETH